MKNLFQRYIWLVDTIYRADKITFEDINRRWVRTEMSDGKPLPLRTFHNHRSEIEELFDINIECDKRNGYVYYIENKDDIHNNELRTYLLNAFSVNGLLNESKKMMRRILFEKIPSGQRFLTTIIEAMRDSRAVKITYQSFWRDTPSTFEVEPYCVKIFRQRWYLLAFNSYFNTLRIYALDRMQDLQASETTFRLPESFDAETFFVNYFGIIADENVKPCTVRLKVFDGQRKYLNTLPLHHSQKETKTVETYSIFEYFVAPTFDFVQEILSRGAEIEVLLPDWLRSEMRDKVNKMSKLYHQN
ncbi:MAG: WYL domain-containing protein [Prevotellaceae bacterium]|jgi:hypothetical protein|nr:WYL domain-containing protein [Prevotellaceae bacterium]